MRGDALSAALAAAPLVQYAATASVAASAWSPRAAFLLPVLLFADVLNPVLKRASGRALPASLTDRPSGKGSRSGPSVSCDIFARFGKPSPTRGTGFPSGHAQSVGVMAAYVTRSLVRLRGAPVTRRAVGIAAAWAVALSVVAHRLYIRCHTVPQVVAGLAVGAGVGWLGNAIAEAAFPGEGEKPPQ